MKPTSSYLSRMISWFVYHCISIFFVHLWNFIGIGCIALYVVFKIDIQCDNGMPFADGWMEHRKYIAYVHVYLEIIRINEVQ
jgi:hypothetical protein